MLEMVEYLPAMECLPELHFVVKKARPLTLDITSCANTRPTISADKRKVSTLGSILIPSNNEMALSKSIMGYFEARRVRSLGASILQDVVGVIWCTTTHFSLFRCTSNLCALLIQLRIQLSDGLY